MSIVFAATIMRGPGDSANAPFPASYVGNLATNMVSRVRPYLGTQPGVNAVISVRYTDSRSLIYKANYYVNESVATTKTNINA